MLNETTFRVIAVGLGALVLPTLVYYHRYAARVESRHPPEEGLIIWILLRLLGLLSLVSVLIYIIRPSFMQWSVMELPIWLRCLAAGIGVVTVGLLYWVFHTLGENLSTTIGARDTRTLVTDGPYRWVRHPLYSVGTAFWIAFSLVSSNWLITLLSVLSFTLIVGRTRIEEENLIEAFGKSYLSYMSKTGRFIPRPHQSKPRRLRSQKEVTIG